MYDQFSTREDFPDFTPKWPEEVQEEWDIVGVQPRGLEGSTKLECEEVNAGPIDQIQRYGGLIKDACDAKMPGYAATLTTENTARDWDQVRQAMGEEKISIYGQSYGTVLGSATTLITIILSKLMDSAKPSTTFSVGFLSTMMSTTWGRHHELCTSPGRNG